MSGRPDSEHPADIAEAADVPGTEPDGSEPGGSEPGGPEPEGSEPDEPEDPEGLEEYDARRARWAAVAAGALLALAGLAAAALRVTGAAPALVPAAYALGGAVCVLAALLGARGRTRRALWLLIAGVAVMALGDQFD
ncbi:hypothetical protein [Streptomyces sp. NPDC000983]|uniref:hypothetical protein n=1 Tax=Streptomyces sp. NPDC000983 TaxID=3154373 RepID=UPI00331ADF2B